jgi:hypothetical protein
MLDQLLAEQSRRLPRPCRGGDLVEQTGAGDQVLHDGRGSPMAVGDDASLAADDLLADSDAL